MFQYPHKGFGEESLVLSNSAYQVEICANKVNIFRGDRAWDFDKEDSIEIARNILQKLAPELLADYALVKPQSPEYEST